MVHHLASLKHVLELVRSGWARYSEGGVWWVKFSEINVVLAGWSADVPEPLTGCIHLQGSPTEMPDSLQLRTPLAPIGGPMQSLHCHKSTPSRRLNFPEPTEHIILLASVLTCVWSEYSEALHCLRHQTLSRRQRHKLWRAGW